MSADDDLICGRHGPTPSTIACRHVCRGVACGFWTVQSDPADARLDAWCDLCNERLLARGRWDDEAENDLKVLCTHCWDEARVRNERVPELARGRAAQLTADEQHRLIHGAVHHLQAIQQRAQDMWNVGLGTDATKAMRWDFDDEKRTVTFSDAGVPYLVTDARMVGSYAPQSGTFQWSWITSGRDSPLVTGMSDLEGFGEVRGIERLTKTWWECDQQEGWEMTALAAYLFGCDLAYRAPFDDNYWYMLLSNARVVA